MNAGSPRRRIFHIGPGLIIALAASIVVGARWVSVQNQIGRQRALPPVIERHVVSSDSAEKAGPTPEVKFVIDRGQKLGLSRAQLAKLKDIQSRWTKLYGPKIAKAKAAAAGTARYLESSKDNRRTPVAQIENRAGPLVALSREISTARRAFWEEAMAILTPAQRKALEKERERAWAARTKVRPQ